MIKFIFYLVFAFILGMLVSFWIALAILILLLILDEYEQKFILLKNKDKYKRLKTKEINGKWKCPNCRKMFTTRSDVKELLLDYNFAEVKCPFCKNKVIIGEKKRI